MSKKRESCVTFSALSCLLVLLTIGENLGAANAQCNKDMWDCDDGQCIDEDDVCDGIVSCRDGSDEIAENCIHMASRGFEFRCAYGALVRGNAKCDGKRDCADNSDELPQLCGNDTKQWAKQLTGICRDDSLMQCQSGECIDRDKKCDGNPDCKDGSDETVELCASLDCRGFLFKCGYGACIRGTGRCNGIRECRDGSDEAATLCNKPRNRSAGTTLISSTSKPPTTTKTTRRTTTARTTSSTRRQFIADPDPCGPAPPTAGACRIPLDRSELIIHNYNCQRGVAPGDIVKADTTLVFQCRKGFFLEGKNFTLCDKGTWRYAFLTCGKWCSLKTLKSGFSTEIDAPNLHPDFEDFVPSGTEVNVKCRYDFVQPTDRTFHRTIRCESGEWDNARVPCKMQCGQKIRPVTQFSTGGVEIDIKSAPWHVAVYSIFDGETYTYICGGTIVSPRIVLSAAHCFWDKANLKFYDKSYFSVAAGKQLRDYNAPKDIQAQKRNISDIIVHEDYNDLTSYYKFDLAILKLTTPFWFNYSIRPACMDFKDAAAKAIRTGEKGSFAGWGRIESDIPSETLQSVEMDTLSYSHCLGAIQRAAGYTLPEDKFCLRDDDDLQRSACKGDSGAGFVIANENGHHCSLAGIISHAPDIEISCARKGLVTLTNIQYLQNLIEKHYKKDLDGA